MKHGHTVNGRVSGTYTAWCHMVQRCTNPYHASWRKYGARGVTVCERWRTSFAAFLADMGARPNDVSLSLELWPDGNGNFEPGNTRWVERPKRRARRRCSELGIAGVIGDSGADNPIPD
jgi:hypothetical protein